MFLGYLLIDHFIKVLISFLWKIWIKKVKKFSYFFLFCKKFLKLVFKPTVLKHSLIFLLKIVKSYFQNIIAT